MKRNSLSLPSIGFISDTAYELPDDLSPDDWREAGLQVARTRGSTQWWIGDWWAFGEHRYGDRKALVQSEEWEGPSFDSCAAAATVARAFETCRRRQALSFHHHREAASLPAEWQDIVLDEAQEQGFSIVALRKRVKEVRSFLSQGWTPDQLARQARVKEGETVVASKRNGGDNLPADRALIDWADAENRLVQIDRQTDWGNPFLLDDDGDRDTILENYRWFIERKPSLRSRLHELRGKVLVCWCHPLPCHGDVLCEEIGKLGK